MIGRSLLAAGALAMGIQSASAATATDTFTVTATVGQTCTVSANDLSFGAYIQTAGLPTDAVSTIDVNCTLATAYNMGLNAGTGTGATVTNRIMRNAASNALNYSLYQDAARTTVWGNTVGTNTASGTGTGLNVPIIMYGRAFANQSATAPAGSYTDTITVTVTY